MKSISTILLFLVFSTLFAFGEPFKKGDSVELTQDVMLNFSDIAFRLGKKGETFTVLMYRADLSRVFLMGKDAAGKDIALFVPENTVAKTGADSVKSKAPEKNIRVVSAEQATFLITTERSLGSGSGSGFLALMDGVVYLVTNYHVVKGATQIHCQSTKESFDISAGPVDVANDLDMVRFPLDRDYASEITGNFKMGDTIDAFGNSGGKNVVTKLNGTILGIGPETIEISNEIIPGNSGGPIADEKGRVVAISTFTSKDTSIDEWIKKGTRFENARRFGVLVNKPIAWTRTTVPTLLAESQLVSNEYDVFADCVLLEKNLVATPYKTQLQLKTAKKEEFVNLLESYNRTCRERADYAAKSQAISTEELERTNQKYTIRARQQLSALTTTITSFQKDFSFASNKLTIPHLRHEHEKLIATMQKWATYIETNMRELTPTVFFSFKPKSQ